MLAQKTQCRNKVYSSNGSRLAHWLDIAVFQYKTWTLEGIQNEQIAEAEAVKAKEAGAKTGNPHIPRSSAG